MQEKDISNEEEILLAEIFNERWKEKYLITWCYLCENAIIGCEDCHGTTCNGGSCEKCRDDFAEFGLNKTAVHQYLTEEEKRIYQKCLRIKHFILDTLRVGEPEINWERLSKERRLSQFDQELFLPENSNYGKPN